MRLSARFVMTVLVFAIVVPGLPILFLAILSIPVFAYDVVSPAYAGSFLGMLFGLGYGGGLFPAAAVGIAVAFRDEIDGAGAGYAALAGLVGGLVFVCLIAIFALDLSPPLAVVLVAVLVLTVISALLAWRLTRRRIVPLSAA